MRQDFQKNDNSSSSSSLIEDYLRVMSFTAFIACYASVTVFTFLTKVLIDKIAKFVPVRARGVGGSLLGTGILIFLAKKVVLLYVLYKLYKMGRMEEFRKAPMETLNKASLELIGWK